MSNARERRLATAFYDQLATWALRVGDAAGSPFYRVERWAYNRWARRMGKPTR